MAGIQKPSMPCIADDHKSYENQELLFAERE